MEYSCQLVKCTTNQTYAFLAKWRKKKPLENLNHNVTTDVWHMGQKSFKRALSTINYHTNLLDDYTYEP